jgi:hypothetical protein
MCQSKVNWTILPSVLRKAFRTFENVGQAVNRRSLDPRVEQDTDLVRLTTQLHHLSLPVKVLAVLAIPIGLKRRYHSK